MSLVVGCAIWFPSAHHFFQPDRAKMTDALARAPADAPDHRMRGVNPEWDFMSRTFTVLALANRALDRPEERDVLIARMDATIDRVLREEREHGQAHFMMAYATRAPFVDEEGSSLFIDGEILMMIAARELVRPGGPDLHDEARTRADRIERTMERSPTLSGESYPDECWTFCNTAALAALAMYDRTSGTNHSDLQKRWVAHARSHLLDPETGILISSYTRDGRVLDGAEGSSIWMSAHDLLVIDPDFARDQYARARASLGRTFLGFGWAREWPNEGRADVDSGPIVPVLEASAGSSGMALLGASAFGDEPFLRSLLASLELAGFPKDGHYQASNGVGDAVVFYALEFGPLWKKVRS